MPEQHKRPNFLFIITDQQRADTLGAHGSTLGATPHLDRMADEGVTFERGYCNNPLCMPSRASIFTGTPPQTLDERGPNGLADVGEGLTPEANGSDDDDDSYAGGMSSPWVDPDAVVADSGRPLIFYQLNQETSVLKLAKEPDNLHLRIEF